jgi:AraC-like DNA-binding protein
MGGTQTLRERPPSPVAARYVSAVSVYTVPSESPGHSYRRVPNGCIDLAYALGTPSVAVLGPGSRHSVAQLEPRTTMIGLRFHPGVGAPILGAPARELASPGLGLDDVWGREARFLAERLSEAGSPERAASLLETEVGTRAADRAADDPLMLGMLEIFRRQPRVDIDDVAVELSLSPRQLGRRSIVAFGYSPKRLQRIIRLQRFLAYDAAFSLEGMSLNRIAWAAGYADQPHLTRECVAITGLAPKQLLASRDRDCAENHTHVAKFVPFMRAPTEPIAA